MIQTKEKYIKQFEQEMEAHPEKELIMAELIVHIEEEMADLLRKGMSEPEAVQAMIEQFGHPNELAAQFGKICTTAPNKVKLWLVLSNHFLFLMGACLTVCYHLGNMPFLQIAWEVLGQYSLLILFMYTGFWLFIGYQIGKEFGAKGKRILFETMSCALIPNLVLMFGILYGVFPTQWFSPFLTPSFVVACLGVTLLFYPFSQFGYYFGRHQAV
ncbi:hypothetical protein DCC39_08220 [Pueribacillus theae]|uniref:Uncharacterized protein n=1 Tax=Pueribacillus theae TaxID=2171751 RepID=A0A2U1K464_9BACI|nr:permease prefix domain 1-containing protein [Pueribacillus theae]PWA12055.1 hypothetical protein DCC39_08220 [Pueribacillus theae]